MRCISLLLLLYLLVPEASAQQPAALPAGPEPEYRFSIYFGGGSAWIDPWQEKALIRFIEDLGDTELYEITIHSHTDPIGGAEYNQWLSGQRSTATMYLLEQTGIPPEKMFIRDFGLHNPLYDNSTAEGRRGNRRVDILLWRQVL